MKRIETSIDIDAPSTAVWDALTDFAAYPEWNPFMTVEGTAREGDRLRVRLTPPGVRATAFRPTVLVAEANRELTWRGRVLLPGLYDGEHSFTLEEREDGTTYLVHAETFTGRPAIERGFWQMNGALKERAEAARITPGHETTPSARS